CVPDLLTAGHLRELLPFLVQPAARLRRLVPVAIRHRIWQHRTLQAVRELPPAALRRLLADIESTIDVERLRWLRRAHLRAPEELQELCDYRRKLEIAIVKALLVRLHDGPRRRILDLGSGGGYFVAVCRHLGHSCDGTEVPASRLSSATAVSYAAVRAALRIGPTIDLAIAANTPIEVPAIEPRSYDLITAHKICFNGHMRPKVWSTPEWRFFVTDVCRFLAPGGQLVLELNEDVARYGSRRWYDAELAHYFGTVGQVVRGWITVERDRVDARS
ncbi:MAG TPA: class I SAM-dependent methyltransferase, partial [Kofleriaceae bacterium]